MTKCVKQCGRLCCTKIEDLTITDGNTSILEKINLHLHCGELTAIIGPNGAGKSTLLKAIIGERKYSGSLEFIGETGTKRPVIGYVPQHLSFDADSPVSVSDLFLSCLKSAPVCFVHSKDKRAEIISALKKVNAENIIDRKLSQLSGGELQRVFLGLALMPVPNLLLLDEPVSGVDKNGIEIFWQILSDLRTNYDLSIIIISHNFSQVLNYADRVVLLDKKVIANGTPKEVFGDNGFKEIFGAGEII